MYDVIVAGAGPAGSTAAATLAQAGRRVLLIDRSTFPRDKTCGDAIQGGAIDLLRGLGYLDLLDATQFTSIKEWTITAPSGIMAAASLSPHEHAPYIARRIDFDLLVYQQAIANGAEFCQAQVTAPIIENGKVVGVTVKPHGAKDTVDLRARLVIAADGATSVIARAVRGGRDEDIHWAVASRCYVKMAQPLNHRCEFYFPKVILPGYAWIFPAGNDSANIGVGMRLDKYRQRDSSLNDLLDLFLDTLGDRVDRNSIESVKSWQIPFGSKFNERTFDGCLLVGDAGNFVDPLLGAGIYFGMKTGQLAAQVADIALRDGDTSRQRLSEYDRRWKRALTQSLRRATIVQKVVISHPHSMNVVLGLAALHPTLSRWVVMTLSGEKI
ncbi:MAG: geranylgeranyl reductase family protein [Chloroflexota bacterium]